MRRALDKGPIEEHYGKIKDSDRSFDVCLWQKHGPLAIFEAAYDMIKDYILIRGENADELRLQRTVESFKKA